MNIQEWAHLLWQQVRETHLLQWIAVGFGVSEVLLAQANKVWLYPTGLAATSISVFILFDAGLYAESLLNLYYIVMSIYGWWLWVNRKDKVALKITFSTRQEWITTILIVLTSFGLLYYALKYFTPSTVPFMDAWVSATAWAGMWLLARRKVENWLLLNVSNAFAIPLLFHKQLPLYAALTLFLFIVAIRGYFRWSKQAKQETPATYLPSIEQ